MAGVQIAALPHNTETCHTRRGLKVFAQEDGSVSGYCFSCGTYIPDPYGDGRNVDGIELPKKKTEAELQAEIAEVDGYQILKITERKLKAETLEEFDARVSVSEVDGVTPTAIYWPVTRDLKKVGYYVKILNKEANPYYIGDCRGSDFFGWEQALKSGAYRIIITEGPEDMASVAQIYKTYGKEEYKPAVVSLPRGGKSAKNALQKFAKELKNNFKEIVFCFDDDEVGQKAVQDGMQIIPDALSVTLPYKDANECILKGASKAAYNALSFRAAPPKNTRLVYAESLHEGARTPPEYGEYTWPLKGLNDLTRGLRRRETIYIGAGVKMGKGELRNEIAAHLIKKHDAKVFIASPEEANNKTYKLIAGKMESKIFHDPKIEFDYEAFDRAGKKIENHMVLLNLYQHMGWDSLRKDMIAAANWGATVHFIDPITNLTNGVNAGDANTELQRIAQDVAAMALDLDLLVFLFCHLKAPDGNIGPETRQKLYTNKHYIGLGNCPHELGGDVYSAQFAGSRAMMRSCNMMLGLEGNKDPDLPENVRNMRRIKVLEDREFGETGTFDVFWNKHTGRFAEA